MVENKVPSGKTRNLNEKMDDEVVFLELISGELRFGRLLIRSLGRRQKNLAILKIKFSRPRFSFFAKRASGERRKISPAPEFAPRSRARCRNLEQKPAAVPTDVEGSFAQRTSAIAIACNPSRKRGQGWVRAYTEPIDFPCFPEFERVVVTGPANRLARESRLVAADEVTSIHTAERTRGLTFIEYCFRGDTRAIHSWLAKISGYRFRPLC